MGLFDIFGKNKDNGLKVCSPLSGKVIPVTEVEDEAFSSEAMGKGVAIIPNEGKLFAPVDGEISVFFPTGHAIGMLTADGMELLMHVGMDTVSLEGDGFTPKAKQGDKVKKGDLLLEFDIEKIKAAGLSVTTPVIITNSDDYADISGVASGDIAVGEELISIKK